VPLPTRPHPALAALLAHRHGTLVLDELPHPARYVIDGKSGELILAVPRHAFEAAQWVLHIPEESDTSLQVLLDPAPIDAASRGHATDRHEACHGPPAEPCWASGTLASARLGGSVLGPEALDLRNPLYDAETTLCRALNADRAALAAACRRRLGRDADSPLAVSVDPWGVVVRCRFGVLRLEFDAPAPDEADARRAIERLVSDR